MLHLLRLPKILQQSDKNGRDMSNRLKQLVDEIQKVAQDAPHRRVPKAGPPAGGGGGGAPAARPAGGGGAVAVPHRGQHGAPSRGGGGYAAPSQIKEMQQKMMDLSKMVQSQMKVEDIAKQDDPRAAGEAWGRDSFSDFMAKMMRGGGGAQEFDPDPKATQMGQKKPSTPSRMYVLMDTIKRVGGPNAELKPDGVWGPRTNQALLDIRAFAGALLQLSGAFGAPNKSYTQQNLQEFVLPKNDTDMSLQDKIKAAPIIIQHLDAITAMFQEFRDSVLENPQYQTYIEDDTPFATIGGPKPQPGQDPGQQSPMLSAEQANEINKIFPVFYIATTQGQNVAQKPLNVTNLLNLSALEAWKKASGVTLSTPQIIKQVRQQIEEYWNKLPEDARLPPKYEDTLPEADRKRLQRGK